MKEQLARLTSDSAVYGISTIVGRFLNFLLVPFYTNVFPADEYGIVTVVYSYMAFLNVVYAFGLEPAYMRFLTDHPADERRDVFSTPMWMLLGTSALCTVLLLSLSPHVAHAVRLRPQWNAIVWLAAATLAVDAVNTVPFASLRMERHARRFAMIRFTSIIINIALNLVFVLVLRLSIVSIFSAGLIASLSGTVMLLPTIRRTAVFRINRPLLRAMLRFGLPTVPAGLAAMVVQVIDRPIMQQFLPEAAVGIYGANYRLGIFMMLIVTMFQYAWQPFYLQAASQPNARALFARVLTYFVLLGSAAVIVVSFFIEDVATIPLYHGRALLGRGYWSGLGIVPIVLFAYLWTGMNAVFTSGLLIEKRTGLLATITGAGAIVNIAANLVLIPLLGIAGGAYATLAAYVAMAVLSWIVTRRIYPVPYEYARLAKIFASFAVCASAWYLIPPIAGLHVLWELALLLLFPVLLFAFRFFLPAELGEMRHLLARFRSVRT